LFFPFHFSSSLPLSLGGYSCPLSTKPPCTLSLHPCRLACEPPMQYCTGKNQTSFPRFMLSAFSFFLVSSYSKFLLFFLLYSAASSHALREAVSVLSSRLSVR
jgi:hypothetical protein